MAKFVWLIIGLMLLSCSNDKSAGGASSETENAIAIHIEGNGSSQLVARVRSVDFDTLQFEFNSDTLVKTPFPVAFAEVRNGNSEWQPIPHFDDTDTVFVDIQVVSQGISVSVAQADICSTQVCGVLKDARDGKQYTWVQLGNDRWLRENLAFDDGREGLILGDSVWQGVYYTWNSALDSAMESVCPLGYGVATRRQWNDLETFAGHDAQRILSELHWEDAEVLVQDRNELQLGLVPSGYIDETLTKFLMGTEARYWSTEEEDSLSAWDRNFATDRISFSDQPREKTMYLPVRCVRTVGL